MKKILRFLFIALITSVVSCSTKENENFVLAPPDFQTKLSQAQDAYLLDVRTSEEITTGIIAGAVNIIYDENFAQKVSEVPLQPIFVYCASGKRSAKAAKILREKGYAPVYELAGGLNAWKEKGLSVNQ
jgi:rhodanese-related sulfurtransferase